MAQNEFMSMWQLAVIRYAEITGKDLKDLPMPKTVEDLKEKLESQSGHFKHFREKRHKLFSALSQALDPIESIGTMVTGAATAAYQPAQQVFGAAMQLVTAAREVSAELDAVVDLFETLKDFTIRLAIYKRVDLSSELHDKLSNILVTVMTVFAYSSKRISDGTFGRIKAFGKNALLHKDKEMRKLLDSLDKSTQGENHLVGAETLVESRRTARAVESVQTSVDEGNAQLNQIGNSVNRNSAGVDQVLENFEHLKEDSRSEKDFKQLELIRKALKPSPSAQDRFDEIQREHIPHSGDWIRDEMPLQSWITSKIKLLWISGHPGSGKSFLTYSIITYLRELQHRSESLGPRTALGFFFFRNNNQQMRSFEQALRDVAFQIGQSNPAFAKHTAKVFRDHPETSSLRSIWSKLFKEFFFVESSSESSAKNPAFLVLDGVDESIAEDRSIFFDLLKDVKEAGANARLHICMIGRPEVGHEISSHLDLNVRSVDVDLNKNGRDVQRYVERSIGNSSVLNRVSESLKQEIVETISSKAGTMFLWVRLMIAELSKKSRERAIKEALHKAPEGLSQMLRHVLEGFSATLTEEDANDLNSMLACVALAKRPLTLGELDTMLRLRSVNGDGVIYLEGKLRKQFASFFVLTREDDLTTADLQTRRGYLDADEYSQRVIEADEGIPDIENETNFNSNQETTTISFTHDSIFQFFRDHKEVTYAGAGDNHPVVGVDLLMARREIAKNCVMMLADENILAQVEGGGRLLPYAKDYWNEHLIDLNPDDYEREDKVTIGKAVARMMQEESLMEKWAGAKGHAYFTSENARYLCKWIDEPDVLGAVDWGTWISIPMIRLNPITLFNPTIEFYAKKWLNPFNNTTWNESSMMRTICHYRKRRAGQIVEGSPYLALRDILATAEWRYLSKNATWYRHVGRVLRDFGFVDAASEHYDKARKLDPGNFHVSVDISVLYVSQRKFKEALKLDEALIQRAETENSITLGSLIFNRVAECYEQLANDVDENGDREEKRSLLQAALDSHWKAFPRLEGDFTWVQGATRILQRLASSVESPKDAHLWDEQPAGPGALTVNECERQIMGILQALDECEVDDTTQLVKCLVEKRSGDPKFLRAINSAAVGQQQLSWLQKKYRQAHAYTEKNMLPVSSAQLALNLAWLYAFHGGDEDRGMRIWEVVAKGKVQSTTIANAQKPPQMSALNQVGEYCLCKALEEKQVAERYVTRMEHFFSKYCLKYGESDTIIDSDLPRFLATWYHQTGREEDALRTVKPYIKHGLAILSDDDLANDPEGYAFLSGALIAMGDYANFLAILLAIRPYRDGQAFIPSQNGATSDSTSDKGEGDDDNTYDTDMCGEWSCEGNCGAAGEVFDGVYFCPYQGLTFCEKCYTRLMSGKLTPTICSKRHSLIRVPMLSPDQRFKKGEMLVDGQIMSFEDWKTSLRTKYNV